MFSRFKTPLTWILSAFLLLFVYTKLFGPIPFSINSVVTQKTTTFDVTGEGKITVRPDMASMTAGITVQASRVKAAQDQINTVINKISEALKQLGIDSKDIQTINYSVYPTYDYSSSTQRITGYNANAALLIKVKDLDKVNDVIDAATGNGANQISGLSFEVEDQIKLEEEARQKAVAEAKKKAEQAAKIVGFKLGKIINYYENFQGTSRPIPLAAGGLMETSKDSQIQIEPGSSEIIINVTLSYEIQ